MNKDLKQGFFASVSDLDLDKYLILDYFFESTIDPEEAAMHLCMEQSTAQWNRVGYDEDFRPEFGAKVIDLHVERTLEAPTYPVLAEEIVRSYACRVKIAHPHKNFGPKIPNMLTAVCGEGAFFSPGITTIKLFDIEFPDNFLTEFQGPKFGIEGIRNILNVYDRPIFFGVIKPNIGLPIEPFAELAYESWLGGLDIAKDDEMLADVSWSPIKKRASFLGDARKRAEKKTGKKKIYLANITDEVDRLIELHDIAVAGGANALMVNGMATGLSAVRMLAKHTKVPLVGHFDFIAPFSRTPYSGVHTKLITKLQRLAGFDAIIMPGFGKRMKTPDKEVLMNVEECSKPLGNIKPVLPVPGGSDSAITLQKVYEKLGTKDFGFVPGRGVFGHPMGPRSGAKSLYQAWAAIQKGVSIEEYAKNNPELQAAIDSFR